MRFQLVARRIILAPALGLALAAAVAACSSSSSPSPTSTSSPSAPASSAPASSAPASPSSSGTSNAVAAITANWEAFFSGKTPAAKKIALLQNGEKFAAVIGAQVGSSLASSASATVSKVVLTSPTTATVTYSIQVSGAGLPNTTGQAVYQDGTWKVADSSFCSLLGLENGGTPPAVCSSAG